MVGGVQERNDYLKINPIPRNPAEQLIRFGSVIFIPFTRPVECSSLDTSDVELEIIIRKIQETCWVDWIEAWIGRFDPADNSRRR